MEWGRDERWVEEETKEGTRSSGQHVCPADKTAGARRLVLNCM